MPYYKKHYVYARQPPWNFTVPLGFFVLRSADEKEREVIYERIQDEKAERDSKVSRWLLSLYLCGSETPLLLYRYSPLLCYKRHENIQQRLNGCDYDSDTMLITDDKLLVEAVDKPCHSIGYFRVAIFLLNYLQRHFWNWSIAPFDRKTDYRKEVWKLRRRARQTEQSYFALVRRISLWAISILWKTTRAAKSGITLIWAIT